MSNIGNQVVAVVATLLGFVAHDYLSEARTFPIAETNTNVAATNVHPVVMRSVNLDRLSLQSLESTAISPAASPAAPASIVTVRTPAMTFDNAEGELASIRNVRSIGMPVETSISGYIR